MDQLWTAENGIAFLTLTLLEVVLGIDNIVFLSILTGKLPTEERPKARRIGLALALIARIGLLLSLTWVMRLTTPLFGVLGRVITGRDLILIGGGLFLIAKATWELHDKLESAEDHATGKGRPAAKFASVIVQISLLDILFSLDSVITAVGMAQNLVVMIAAVIVAVLVMLVSASLVGEFVERHPTVKVLALAFLILIGVRLVAEGLGRHIEQGYVYFAMAFSLGVEFLNLRIRGAAKPVRLRHVNVNAGEEPPAAA